MVSLFHHSSPWTHRCLQSSPSAQRNGRVFRRSVQTACCYWIFNRGKSSSNWNSQTNASRLWWSVCWCEYSKTLGDVKCVDVSTVRRWVTWSVLMWVQYDAGWREVCWCEYSKTLGKVKCVDVSTVRCWVTWSLQWGNGFKNKTPIFLRTDFKNWCSVGGSVLKRMVTMWKNNYSALKIIYVGIFLFLFH